MASTSRTLWSRLQLPVLTLAATHVFGVVGFKAVWGEAASWMDALFMTFITVTSIGYGEVHPLSTAGRFVAMLVAAGGLGSVAFTFTIFLEHITSEGVRAERRRRKMQKRIEELQDHYIVAGIGRVGREAAHELVSIGAAFVIVDPADSSHGYCEERGWLFVQGDATEDSVLERAGVRRAKGLIVTTANDATNLFVVLSARMLNPTLYIASRAVDHAATLKLERAGANRAISPYAIGGRRLAHLMVNPRVVDFLETALRRGKESLGVDAVVVGPGSKADGATVGSLALKETTGVTLLALLRQGVPVADVRGDTVLAAGDHVLVLGTAPQLLKLETILAK